MRFFSNNLTRGQDAMAGMLGSLRYLRFRGGATHASYWTVPLALQCQDELTLQCEPCTP